jgi:hypothetical protein
VVCRKDDGRRIGVLMEVGKENQEYLIERAAFSANDFINYN